MKRITTLLVLLAMRLLEGFNRYLLREHFQCKKDSHNFIFDRGLFGITSSFTLAFWFKFEPRENIRQSPLVTFSRTNQAYAAFSLSYDLSSLGVLDFSGTPIMSGIFSSSYMAESSSSPEITIESRLNWVFITLAFQATNPSPVSLFITANLNTRIQMAQYLPFDIGPFLIHFGGVGQSRTPCPFEFYIRDFYVYEDYYTTQEDVTSMSVGAPGRLSGLFFPRPFSQFENVVRNFAPGRGLGNIKIESGIPLTGRMKSDNRYFSFSDYQVRFILPKSIVRNSPVDQSYIYSITCSINSISTEAAIASAFALYRRVSFASNTTVLISAEYQSDNAYFFFTLNVNNSTEEQFSLRDIYNRELLIVAVAHNCLSQTKKIKFYISNYGTYIYDKDLSLSATDVHFMGHVLDGLFPSFSIDVYEISTIYGSEFVVPATGTNTAFSFSLNSSKQNFSISCEASPHPIRLHPENNDLLTTTVCSLSLKSSHCLLTNCALCYNGQCKICHFDYYLDNFECVKCSPESNWDMYTRKCNYNSQGTCSSSFTITSCDWPNLNQIPSTTINPSSGSGTNNYSAQTSSIIVRLLEIPNLYPLTAIVPLSPSEISKQKSDLEVMINNLVVQQKFRQKVTTNFKFYTISASAYQNLINVPPFFNCSLVKKNYTQTSRFEAICVNGCDQNSLYDNTTNLCVPKIPNCQSADGPVCLTCNDGYLLQNYRCLKIKIQNLSAYANITYNYSNPIVAPRVKQVFPSIESSVPGEIDSNSTLIAHSTSEFRDFNDLPAYIQTLQGLGCSVETSNCISCDASKVCLRCIPGFRPDGGCLPLSCSDPNCLICSDFSTCVQCKVNFEVDNQNQCLKTQFISNFEVPNVTIAEAGDFSLEMVSLNTECKIENCLNCLNSFLCGKCEPFFHLTSDFFACIETISKLLFIGNSVIESASSANDCSLCTNCQIGTQLQCPNCSLCTHECICSLKSLRQKNTFQLTCPQITFSKKAVNERSFRDEFYSAYISEESTDSLVISGTDTAVLVDPFILEPDLVESTLNCTLLSNSIYFMKSEYIKPNISQTTVSRTLTTYSVLSTAAIFTMNILVQKVSQFFISIVDSSAYLVYFSLLNVNLGAYFESVTVILLEKVFFEVEFLLGSFLVHPEYRQIYPAFVSSGWMFVSVEIFLVLSIGFIGFCIIRIIIKILKRYFITGKKTKKIIKFVNRYIKLLFVSFVDFNYMGTLPVIPYIISFIPQFDFGLKAVVYFILTVSLMFGLLYSKYEKVTYFLKFWQLLGQPREVKDQRNFSSKNYFITIHGFVTEQLQVCTALLAFVFQKYKIGLARILMAETIIELYICFFFAERYNAGITALKILYCAFQAMFALLAWNIVLGFNVEDSLLNIIYVALMVVRLLELIYSLKINYTSSQKRKARKLLLQAEEPLQ
jgi:hypothetical protein